MYTYKELLSAYESVGVEKNGLVYVTGNFGRPGLYETPGKSAILQAHFDTIIELLGSKGTIVVPTHSFSLCNTLVPFDINNTKSERGPFTEFVRKKPSSVRQFHPFASLTAYGYLAKDICLDTPRHAYGVHSPFGRMVEKDALFVSVGQEIEKSVALVHHAEFMMGVPYRYTKEFSHPCVISGNVQSELFYLQVLWKGCDIERDVNKKIINNFKKKYTVSESTIGSSTIFSVSMNEFFSCTTDLFKQDIYSWLAKSPINRPFCH